MISPHRGLYRMRKYPLSRRTSCPSSFPAPSNTDFQPRCISFFFRLFYYCHLACLEFSVHCLFSGSFYLTARKCWAKKKLSWLSQSQLPQLFGPATNSSIMSKNHYRKFAEYYFSDKTVVWIQISMNYILRVEVGHAGGNVFREIRTLLPRKRFVGVLDQVSQGTAWNELSD